jgi:hypothetical protein
MITLRFISGQALKRLLVQVLPERKAQPPFLQTNVMLTMLTSLQARV